MSDSVIDGEQTTVPLAFFEHRSSKLFVLDFVLRASEFCLEMSCTGVVVNA